MRQVLLILFSAGFTVAVCIGFGRLMLRRVVSGLYSQEADALGFVCGGAVLSSVVFVLSAMHVARKGVFLAIGGLVLAAAWRWGSPPTRRASFPPMPTFWRWFFIAGFSIFTLLYVTNAMAPEFSPDGVSYHLSFVARYLREHGFVQIPYNMYAQLSQGVELLYMLAFAFGRHSAAAMVHFAFLLGLTVSLLNFGRRIGHPAAGAAAALFFYATPVVGVDGISAYIDVAVAAILFTVFYLLQIWDANRSTVLLIVIGLTAGFAYAAKYTAFLAIPYAIGFVLWKTRRVRPVLIVGLCSLVLVAPWVIKNVLWAGNPFSPMLNSVFPNPTVHISFEQNWSAMMRSYQLPSRWLIPYELMIHGEKLSGLIGPLFLLLAFAWIALRSRAGRRVLVPAVLFTIPYAANIGARFTIPALPFWCFALALAFINYPRLLGLLAALHCVFSWPGMMHLYSSQYVWSVEKILWKQALRIEREDGWLTRAHPDYLVARMIEAQVPKGARVLSFNGKAEAYTTREIAVAFQSARGEVLRDMFYCAFSDDFQPRLSQEFRFPALPLRKFRVVQTASAKDAAEWSISELRIYSEGVELPRAANWRLRARPNPWEISLAFDNSPVSRWKTWEPFRPGMYVEVDLGAMRTIDQVTLHAPVSAGLAEIRLDAQDAARGGWRTVAANPVHAEAPAMGFLGPHAIAEIKARGFDYIVLESSEWGAAEVLDSPTAWGLEEVAHVDKTHLMRITLPGPVLQMGQEITMRPNSLSLVQ